MACIEVDQSRKKRAALLEQLSQQNHQQIHLSNVPQGMAYLVPIQNGPPPQGMVYLTSMVGDNGQTYYPQAPSPVHYPMYGTYPRTVGVPPGQGTDNQ